MNHLIFNEKPATRFITPEEKQSPDAFEKLLVTLNKDLQDA